MKKIINKYDIVFVILLVIFTVLVLLSNTGNTEQEKPQTKTVTTTYRFHAENPEYQGG